MVFKMSMATAFFEFWSQRAPASRGFVIFFVLQPALQGGSLQTAAIRGALFGFATYMTYDLTNYATIKGFPLRIVIIDLIWGTFLTAAISSIAYVVYTKLF